MIRYLSLKGFATYTGLAYNTVKDYKRKNLLPKADAVLGGPEGMPEDAADAEHSGWLPETIDGWKRPGPGARTDLQRRAGSDR